MPARQQQVHYPCQSGAASFRRPQERARTAAATDTAASAPHSSAPSAGRFDEWVAAAMSGASVSLGTNSVGTAAAFLERADLDRMLVAGRYTLLDRSAADLIDACADRGVAYLAAGVFNSGVPPSPSGLLA